MFAPMNLPQGTIYRSGAGAPGAKYWQQRADYGLRRTPQHAADALTGEQRTEDPHNPPGQARTRG